VEGRPTEEGQGAALDFSAARRKPELFISGECLAEGPRQTPQTMLPEALHGQLVVTSPKVLDERMPRAVILGWRGPYGAACVNPTGIVSYEHPQESPLLKGEEASQPPMKRISIPSRGPAP